MTSAGADPDLLQKIAETDAEASDAAAAITEDLLATETELAEEARLDREANEQFSRELDEQVEQRLAGQADDASKHRWPGQPQAVPAEHTFGFEEAEQAQAGRHASAEPSAAESSATHVDARPHRSHARDEEFDDDDFSNNSWLG